MNVLLALDKYSDFLEAYSFLSKQAIERLVVVFLENERNSRASVESNLIHAGLQIGEIEYMAAKLKPEFLAMVRTASVRLRSEDALVAPFIRYRDLWSLTRSVAKGVTTVHLSETVPDSFGHIGYRLGFRGGGLKAWLTLPLAKAYAVWHKPMVCFYPLMPEVTNPFVSQSLPASIPVLPAEKANLLLQLLGTEPRPLLIGGFGYDAARMAEFNGTARYIATSKNQEIVVDGEVIPLPFHISAEEVMLAVRPSAVIAYPSTACIWAKRIYPSLGIECYAASELDRIYGSLYTKLAGRAMAKVGIVIRPEEPRMLTQR